MKVLFVALNGLSEEQARSWICSEYGDGSVRFEIKFCSGKADEFLSICLGWKPDLVVLTTAWMVQTALLMDLMRRHEATRNIPDRIISNLERKGDVIMEVGKARNRPDQLTKEGRVKIGKYLLVDPKDYQYMTN
jgi:hypothetical protein